MRAMICELCGSNDIVKTDGVFVCQNCGTKYSVEEAKKLLGTVQIDKTNELENWWVLARRARDNSNADQAKQYYSLILSQEPENWEATFFTTYFSSYKCKLAEIPIAGENLRNAISNAADLLFQSDEPNKPESMKTITMYSMIFADMVGANAKKWWDEHSPFASDGWAWVDARANARKWGNTGLKIYSDLEKIAAAHRDTEELLVSIRKSFLEYLKKYGCSTTDKKWVKSKIETLSSQLNIPVKRGLFGYK